MVLKKEDDLFCLHLPFSTIGKLEDSGIVNMGDFINSDIEEIIDSGRYDLREIKYIRKRHRQYVSGEIEIVGHYLHRDFEAGADIDDKYFRHRDGLRYKDVVLEEIIDDAHDLKTNY